RLGQHVDVIVDIPGEYDRLYERIGYQNRIWKKEKIGAYEMLESQQKLMAQVWSLTGEVQGRAEKILEGPEQDPLVRKLAGKIVDMGEPLKKYRMKFRAATQRWLNTNNWQENDK